MELLIAVLAFILGYIMYRIRKEEERRARIKTAFIDCMAGLMKIAKEDGKDDAD